LNYVKLIKVGIIYVSHDRLSLKTFRFVVKGAYLFILTKRTKKCRHWTLDSSTMKWGFGYCDLVLRGHVLCYLPDLAQ